MKKLLIAAALTLPLTVMSGIRAQTTTAPSGDTTSSMPATQNLKPAEGIPGDHIPDEIIQGWSVKDKLGQSVYNEKDEKIGDIKDVVIASEGKASYFIVGVGGFLGMAEHEVAIPYDKITGIDKLMLQGYTQDQLKALPRVQLFK